MKYFVLLLTFVLYTSIGSSQTAHIDFTSATWEEALKMAKKEDKIIFVDAFTTWCGPCKMMAKKVFTDPDVKRYYDEHFINMKIDMEKGEGILFARAYDIEAYPTYVFVDAHGNIAHKGLGYMKPETFIAFGEAASDEENRLGTLEMKYKKGERDPSFLKKYSQVLNAAYDDKAAKIATEYLASQDDWSSAENATYVVEMAVEDPDSKLYKYMAKHRSDLLEHVDQDKLDYKLKVGVMRQIHADNMNLEEQGAFFNKIFEDKGPEYFAEYNMKKYSRLQNDDMKEKYFNAASEYINTYDISNWQLLNQVAWTFYEQAEDEKYLKQARDWAKTSVSKDSNFMNNDTLAALYFKLGDKKNATKFAKNAIELAKESGQDYTETEELLQKIKSL